MPPIASESDERYHPIELHRALLNNSLHPDGLRYDITPVGLHFTLSRYGIPDIGEAGWRLRIAGLVAHPLSIALDELKTRPARTTVVTLECAGNGRAFTKPRPISLPWWTGAVGTAEWTGVPLRALLREAGIEPRARHVVFAGADRGITGGAVRAYERGLSVDDAMRDDVLVAWAMNGAALPPQHGFPVRLIVPGWYGMASVKWLRSIEAIAAPFTGYHQVRNYLYRTSEGDPGTPVTLQRVRSVMMPPGLGGPQTRERTVRQTPMLLRGRAWSGQELVSRVEVSTDAGASWSDADLEAPRGNGVWRHWTYSWTPSATGKYVLCSRAHDSAGNAQPLEQFWNLEGCGNNMVERLAINVVDSDLERDGPLPRAAC